VLARPKTGLVRCLGGCDKLFLSRDVKTNRICPECARKSQRDFNPRVFSSLVYPNGRRLAIPED
jgi:hypothetical protein